MANDLNTPTAPSAPAPLANDPDRLLSFKQACAFLSIGARLGWTMCNRGELPGIRVGKLWRFRRSALVAWTEARERKGVCR